MKDRQSLYTAGEFAKLCNTTKETLRHYANIGLLRPVLVGTNGYQYYRAAQVMEFNVICTLKMAGSSLGEIKSYQKNPGNLAFMDMLKDKRTHLQLEQKKLERMERLLTQSIHGIELALTYQDRLYEPSVSVCPEEYLITKPVTEEQTDSEKAMIDILSEHLDYCRTEGFLDEFQLGVIIPQASFLQEHPCENAYYSRVMKKVDSPRLRIKPAGTYATMLYDDATDEYEAAYNILKEYISRNGYKICGDAYEQELSIYLGQSEKDLYAIQLSVQIQ